MKVTKKSVTSTQFPSSTNKVDQKKGPVVGDDSVELSGSASVLPHALEVLANTPDIRTEAVAPIQKEMQDGSYHRDEVKVAEKVIEDHIVAAQ